MARGRSSNRVAWKHAEAFPIVGRVIRQAYGRGPLLVGHGDIVQRLLQDNDGRRLIHMAYASNSQRSPEQHASDMVAWFSQQISVNASDWKSQFERRRIGDHWAYRPVDPLPDTSGGSNEVETELLEEAERADRRGAFDPKNFDEARERVLQEIIRRRGQPEFRRQLLDAYSGRCAVTGCDCPDALEAAHINPYRGNHTNHVQNGILLRSDVHTLFDIGRIGIAPMSYEIVISTLLKATVYGELEGRKLQLPARLENRPNDEALHQHLDRYGLRARGRS